jgi:REP-associated tyrosine transposase
MHSAPRRHQRRSIRLREYDYSQPGVYFVTICTHRKRCLFGDVLGDDVVLNDLGRIVQAVWDKLSDHYASVKLDVSTIMPNHVHALIALIDTDRPPRHGLPEIVRAFKAFACRRINAFQGTPGASVWQRNYYEHIVRNETELNALREYISTNPRGWALDRENPNWRG